MKNVSNYLVAFVLVAMSGCVVKVNGKVHSFGVSGEEKAPEKGAGDAANPDALAAELSGGATTPSGQSVTIKPTFTPNPTVVGKYTVTPDVSTSGAPHGASCYGYVGEEPTVTLNLTSSMKDMRISAPGAALILAEFGNRKFVCKESGYDNNGPSVLLDPEWPEGEVKLFVGGQKGKTYTFEVRLEDEKRPIDILWKDKVKTVDVAEVPKDPIVITEVTPKTAGVKGRCGNSFFRDIPDVAFVLKRPLGDMSIEVRSPRSIDVQFVGPLTEDGRKIPTSCLNNDRTSFNRMEPGMYGLRIGTSESGAEALYHIIVRGKDTSRNAVQVPTKFVDEATVDESVITWHYPQLLENDIQTSDANREAIFLATPKPIYVFPKFNMDKSVAEILGGGNTRSNDKNAPVLEFPKENEPMMLLNRNGYVVGADGSMFRVNMKDLQADASGAVAIPAAPRNTALSFDQAVRQKGPEDAKAFAAWEKAGKDLDACNDRANSSFEGSFQSACAGFEKALEKKREALEKELTKNRIARRAASLAKIKPRLETLFKK